jgi:hypothetical protein
MGLCKSLEKREKKWTQRCSKYLKQWVLRCPLEKIENIDVTPQVFGFHNCIAFHKHEHHSSHSGLYFLLQHEYATYSNMLLYNYFAYEM